ncbi:TVP38/TMEM64 family protein [uncultured Brevundimonas sp.]|uniref:TVP38/TMEM64 family protein n=1 Tax=uncultured Brevundimonas sp. TaxID=213418 RepID=UPI0026134F75|nr:TVP38/TMEM64 family protein [uncultured Brevundimonas sp.]
MARLRQFIPLILIVASATLVFAMGWNRYLSFETLREHGALLTGWVERHYILVLLGLMALFAILTASVVPGVVFITLTAGYLFGPWVGGVATAFAATVGALAVYYAGRTALGDGLRRRAERDQGLLKKICDGVERNTFSYVLTARLIVSVPFHMINVAAGIMAAPLRPYMIATFIGLLPAHIIYCWIGSGLSEVLASGQNPNVASLAREFVWPLTGVAFLSVILPLGLKLLRSRYGNADADESAGN